MKSAFKMVSAFLVVMLVLAAFPTTSAHAACTNAAAFIMDNAPLDNTKFAPGTKFDKSWVVRNVGTCTWDSTYSLVNVDTGGDPFGGTPAAVTTSTVGRYQTVTLTVTGMTAPAATGTYISNWMLSVGSVKFGVGGWGGTGVPIFAKIKVVAPPAVAYDFAEASNFSSASWSSSTGAQTLPFPTPPTSAGYAEAGSTFKFETGVTPTQGILVIPDSNPSGFIQGEYNTTPYHVNSGDRFQTTVGCEFSSTACHVRFKIQYRIVPSGPVITLGTYLEKHEGLTRYVDINLSSLAGKDVQFILRAENYWYPGGVGASAIWGNPVIVGTGGPIPPSTSGWNTYVDSSSAPFSFMYPPDSTTDFAKDTITLPKGTGVNKTLEISRPAPDPTSGECKGAIPGTITKDEIYSPPGGLYAFNFQQSTDGSDTWIAYTSENPGGGCVSLAFKLSSTSPPAADLKLLEKIIFTFTY